MAKKSKRQIRIEQAGQDRHDRQQTVAAVSVRREGRDIHVDIQGTSPSKKLYFLVEVELKDESFMEPSEVHAAIEDQLGPIDAHDPNVKVLALHDLVFEGRIGSGIHQDKEMFDDELVRRIHSVESNISVSANIYKK